MKRGILQGRWSRMCTRAVLTLLVPAAILLPGCSPAPGADVVEGAIAEHFQKEGYIVREVTVGRIFRNPVAEREYMAPLTYVAEIPSIALEPAAVEPGERGLTAAPLTYADVTIKIQALSPPQQGWAVSHVEGVVIPPPSR